MCGMSIQFPTKSPNIVRIQSLSFAKKMYFTLTFVPSIVRTCKTSDCHACLHVAACHGSWRQDDWGESKSTCLDWPRLHAKDVQGCLCTALHSANAAYPTLSHTSHLPHKMGLVDHLEQLDNVIILRAGNQQPRDNQRCALKRSNQSDVIYYEEANWYTVVREI